MKVKKPQPLLPVSADYAPQWEHSPIYSEPVSGPTWSTMMQDAVIGGAVEELIEETLQDPYELQLEPADPILTEQLEALDMESVWRSALEALWRGFAVHQVTWAFDKGRFNLQQPVLLEHDRIALDVDRVGTILRLLYDNDDGHTRHLDAPGYWLHRHRPNRTAPAGRPRLIACARAYAARDELIKRWGRSIRRNGLPIVVIQHPQALGSDQLAAIKTAVLDLDSSGGLFLPDNVAYTAINPTYAATISVREALGYMDAQIRYAITLSWSQGTVMGRDTVYNAAAESRDRPHIKLVDALRRELSHSSEQLLGPIMRANWGPDAKGRIWWQPTPTPTAEKPTSTTSDSSSETTEEP